jgi:hypothetical protein
MTQPDPTGLPDNTQPLGYFASALDDAEHLLKYAAEIGVDVSDPTRNAILHARAVDPSGWNEEVVANLLAALTSLSNALKPVSAESLKAYSKDTRATVNYYLRFAIILACFIIPISVASFVAAAISTAIRTDIDTANALTVQLRSQLGAAPPAIPNTTSTETPIPPGADETAIITELQSFAATVRVLYARSSELRWIVLPHEDFIIHNLDSSQFRTNSTARRQIFEISPGLKNYYTTRDELTSTYQDVRYFGQTLLDDASVFYGAITTCFLPVLYALLGTCAYLLRNFEDQMSTRTFIPSVANSARFLIAAIGGAVVGLFNNFVVGTQVSIPPLALAFLVGYAVDVFFAFLEGILKSFTKSTAEAPARVPVTKP